MDTLGASYANRFRYLAMPIATMNEQQRCITNAGVESGFVLNQRGWLPVLRATVGCMIIQSFQ